MESIGPGRPGIEDNALIVDAKTQDKATKSGEGLRDRRTTRGAAESRRSTEPTFWPQCSRLPDEVERANMNIELIAGRRKQPFFLRVTSESATGKTHGGHCINASVRRTSVTMHPQSNDSIRTRDQAKVRNGLEQQEDFCSR